MQNREEVREETRSRLSNCQGSLLRLRAAGSLVGSERRRAHGGLQKFAAHGLSSLPSVFLLLGDLSECHFRCFAAALNHFLFSCFIFREIFTSADLQLFERPIKSSTRSLLRLWLFNQGFLQRWFNRMSLGSRWFKMCNVVVTLVYTLRGCPFITGLKWE